MKPLAGVQGGAGPDSIFGYSPSSGAGSISYCPRVDPAIYYLYMEDSLIPEPVDDSQFTTGLLASIWYTNPEQRAQEVDNSLRAMEVEHRVEQAREKLERIVKAAKQAEARIARAERRFENLRESFDLLRHEWQEFKRQRGDSN